MFILNKPDLDTDDTDAEDDDGSSDALYDKSTLFFHGLPRVPDIRERLIAVLGFVPENIYVKPNGYDAFVKCASKEVAVAKQRELSRGVDVWIHSLIHE